MKDRDVEFLFEMGQIRYIQRLWRRFLTPEFENLAEHTFRVAWIALMVGKHEGADLGKVAKMALVHDITESRIGDVDEVSRVYVERKEEMAIKEMLKGTEIEAEFLGLWEEYEKRESLEAKVVKDSDNIDIDMELQEQASRGNDLRKVLPRDIIANTKMYTQTGKKLIKDVQKADPHAWHINAKNRRNIGDWKE